MRYPELYLDLVSSHLVPNTIDSEAEERRYDTVFLMRGCVELAKARLSLKVAVIVTEGKITENG
jgi:hypothetical protein